MKKLIYINLIFAALIFSSGCKKGFLADLAVNPNQPSQAPASLILPPILTGYAVNSYFSSSTIGLWMGYYSISGGYSVTDNTISYYVSAAGPSNWDNLYNILKNAAYMEANSSSNPEDAYSLAVAKVMKAWGFQILVDAYGNVPYSEAFKGSENFFPKYDNGQAIYDSSIAQLDNAINLIENAPATAKNLGANDIMFSGDMTLWAKFANTLKLRYI
ncbi:MAG: SusD/RagB family nutrient-binding outer membrane lipoprotein, partial [Ginsengibacter sp.]